jgi:ATP-dependent DNA helicase HFM1/MER3
MKPNERPILREFNKSPFIKYQVKETVATTAHKVSLMIQVQLGGVEYPNEKEFNMIKRQFMVDKSVIFEKVQRLMRCVIDCKSVDEDAIATRHALDLARSLSAEIWEYSNLQLRQLQGVGPSAVRTMVSSNINSIEKLDEKDASGIERIMSKNPPYGKKMKDNLATFPRLELKSEIVGKAPFKQGRRPKVYVKVILSYRGAKTPVWGGKRPSLTFMAETSDGRLVHFWRGNIAKLDKGFEIRFDVEVSSVDEQIKCWIACDEVVGTVKSSTLQHDIPSSHFPAPSPAEGRNTRELFNASIKKSLSTDEFGDDDFSEDDLVAAIKRIEKGSKNNDSDGFTNIDDLENSPQAKKLGVVKNGKADPERMSNGKYACQHNCRDGQLLKNGKSCKHRCCSEGLDKPPARKRKVRLVMPPYRRCTDTSRHRPVTMSETMS